MAKEWADKWEGTPRDDRELAFWQAAYLMVVRIQLERDRPGHHEELDVHRRTALETANKMLEDFQATLECMEDHQHAGKR